MQPSHPSGLLKLNIRSLSFSKGFPEKNSSVVMTRYLHTMGCGMQISERPKAREGASKGSWGQHWLHVHQNRTMHTFPAESLPCTHYTVCTEILISTMHDSKICGIHVPNEPFMLYFTFTLQINLALHQHKNLARIKFTVR